MKYIPADKLIAKIERRIEETKSMKPTFDQFWAGQISAFKGALKIVKSLQQEQPEGGCSEKPNDLLREQPEVDLEKAARYVYESWNGGTMDDVRRDMVELGKVLNARKKE